MLFVYPPALHAHFTSCKNAWKGSLLFICRSWDASAENRLASTVAQLRQIANKLRFHVLLQEVKCAWSAGGYTKNIITNGHKTRPRLKKHVPRNVVQMWQIAIKVKVFHCLAFRGCRHRAESTPPARSNTLLFVAFALLVEDMKQYDWEGKSAASTWNTKQLAPSDAVDGNRPITKTSCPFVNSRLSYSSPEKSSLQQVCEIVCTVKHELKIYPRTRRCDFSCVLQCRMTTHGHLCILVLRPWID